MTRLERLGEERRNFLTWSVGSLVIVVLADLLGRRAGAETLRLALVIAFFTGLMCAVWSLTDPLARFLHARTLGRSGDGSGEADLARLRYADELAQVARAIAAPVQLGVAAVALRVLSAWPVFAWLAPLRGLLAVVLALALAWLAIAIGRAALRESRMSLITGAIRRQTANESDGETPSAGDPALAESALEIAEAGAFRLAGVRWSWPELRSHVVVMGQTGSGKTATVLNNFLEALVGCSAPSHGVQPAGALILDPKGDFKDKIARVCARHGRSGDLVLFDPSSPSRSVRWNPLDAPLDDPGEIAAHFAAVLRLLGMKAGDDTFFLEQARMFLRYAIAVARASSVDGTPPSVSEIHAFSQRSSALEARLLLLNVASGVRRNASESDRRFERVLQVLNDPAATHDLWKLASTADRRDATLREHLSRFEMMSERERRPIVDEVSRIVAPIASRPIPDEFGPASPQVQDFVLNSWFGLPDKTRDSVRAQVLNMLDPLIWEPYESLLSGRSTMSLGALLDQGRILYVHMPVAERPEMSRTVNTLIKLSFFREVMKRLDKGRPSFFFCDEFQEFLTTDEGTGGDTNFFERSRQSNHANVIATQSIASLKRVVSKPEMIESLLGNCGTKIFLRNTDPATNEFAERIGGTRKEINVAIAETSDRSGGRRRDRGGFSVTETTQTQPRFPRDLFPRLAIPTPQSGADHAEAVVVLGARQPAEVRRLRFRVKSL